MRLETAKSERFIEKGLLLAVYEAPGETPAISDLKLLFEEYGGERRSIFSRHFDDGRNLCVEKGHDYFVCWYSPESSERKPTIQFCRIERPVNDDLAAARKIVMAGGETIRIVDTTSLSSPEEGEDATHKDGIWYEIESRVSGDVLVQGRSGGPEGTYTASMGVYRKKKGQEGFAALETLVENCRDGRYYLKFEEGETYCVWLGSQDGYQGRSLLKLMEIERPQNYCKAMAREISLAGDEAVEISDDCSHGQQELRKGDYIRTYGSWYHLKSPCTGLVEVCLSSKMDYRIIVQGKDRHTGSEIVLLEARAGRNLLELVEGEDIYILVASDKGGKFDMSFRKGAAPAHASQNAPRKLWLTRDMGELKVEDDSTWVRNHIYYSLATDFDGKVKFHGNVSVLGILQAADMNGKTGLFLNGGINDLTVKKGKEQFFALNFHRYGHASGKTDYGPFSFRIKVEESPRNDNFLDARRLVFEGRRLDVEGGNSGATAEEGEEGRTHSVWYNVSVLKEGYARLYLASSALPSSDGKDRVRHGINPVISVYEAARGERKMAGLKPLIENQDYSTDESCTLKFAPDREYYVCVDSRDAGTFSLTISPLSPPPNACFANAEILDWDGEIERRFQGECALGLREPKENPLHSNTVWYVYKSGFSGIVRVHDQGFFLGSGYRARLSVYRALSEPAALDKLETIQESLEFAEDGFANFKVEEGQAYYLCFDLEYRGLDKASIYADRMMGELIETDHREKDDFCFALKRVEAPKNDNLQEAAPLFLGATNSLSVVVDLLHATREPLEAIYHRNSVWYALETSQGGCVRIASFAIGEPGFNTKYADIEIYERQQGSGFAALKPLSLKPAAEQLVMLEEGRQYLVCCDGPKGERIKADRTRSFVSGYFSSETYLKSPFTLHLDRLKKPMNVGPETALPIIFNADGKFVIKGSNRNAFDGQAPDLHRGKAGKSRFEASFYSTNVLWYSLVPDFDGRIGVEETVPKPGMNLNLYLKAPEGYEKAKAARIPMQPGAYRPKALFEVHNDRQYYICLEDFVSVNAKRQYLGGGDFGYVIRKEEGKSQETGTSVGEQAGRTPVRPSERRKDSQPGRRRPVGRRAGIQTGSQAGAEQ